MYLSSIQIKNFRCFDDQDHTIEFNSGLTVLVGENDSGKSAILDAIKIVLGTTDLGWYRLESTDFHNEDTTKEISIVCKFSNLTSDEQAAFLECLTYEKQAEKMVPFLYLHWNCKYVTTFKPPRSISNLTSGKEGNGPAPSAEARELVRVTYLRALRDAYSDMQSGRHSRLSQIIQHIPTLTDGKDEYQPGMDLQELSLLGITNLSNDLLVNHPVLKAVNSSMEEILSKQLLLKQDEIKTRFEVADSRSKELQKINALLEKLDLSVDNNASSMQGKVGLGTSNILSMACELLLHKEAEKANRSSFLLIEEPEAHIHAQRQLKLVQSLEDATANQQIIITTHSPLLASVVKLGNVIIIKDGKTFSLAEGKTKLETDDYWFLEKYLDATKANLFFARSVIIVEGPGEALLIPALASLLGHSFTDYGVSLVDVRGIGLRRYAKIFQRADESNLLNVRVACVTDRDIMPDCAPAICIDEKYTSDSTSWPDKSKRQWRAESDFTQEEAYSHVEEIKKRADGQLVKTFVSNHWTLEYDLALVGLEHPDMKDILIDALISVSYKKENWKAKKITLTQTLDSASTPEEKAASFYSYFTSKKASKADFAQMLALKVSQKLKDKPDVLREAIPSYLCDAIEYVIGG